MESGIDEAGSAATTDGSDLFTLSAGSENNRSDFHLRSSWSDTGFIVASVNGLKYRSYITLLFPSIQTYSESTTQKNHETHR